MEKTLNEMHRLEQAHAIEFPLLVHTDVRLVHKNGSEQYRSRKHHKRQRPGDFSLKNDLVQNTVQGCTAMINRPLLDLAAPIPDVVPIHDMWVGLIASAAGKRGYMREQSMDYRQHTGNVSTGAHNVAFPVVIDRMHSALDRQIEQARALDQRVGTQMPEEHRRIVSRFLEIASRPQPMRGMLLLSEGYHRIPATQVLTMFGGKS